MKYKLNDIVKFNVKDVINCKSDFEIQGIIERADSYYGKENVEYTIMYKIFGRNNDGSVDNGIEKRVILKEQDIICLMK